MGGPEPQGPRGSGGPPERRGAARAAPGVRDDLDRLDVDRRLGPSGRPKGRTEAITVFEVAAVWRRRVFTLPTSPRLALSSGTALPDDVAA